MVWLFGGFCFGSFFVYLFGFCLGLFGWLFFFLLSLTPGEFASSALERFAARLG